jgi:hypothetical protein
MENDTLYHSRRSVPHAHGSANDDERNRGHRSQGRHQISKSTQHAMHASAPKPTYETIIENSRSRTIQELQLYGNRYTVSSIKVEICLNRHVGEDGEWMDRGGSWKGGVPGTSREIGTSVMAAHKRRLKRRRVKESPPSANAFEFRSTGSYTERKKERKKGMEGEWVVRALTYPHRRHQTHHGLPARTTTTTTGTCGSGGIRVLHADDGN